MKGLRVRLPAFDRLAFALERRAYRRAARRARAGRLTGDRWRSPTRLWPNFGED